MSGLDIASRIKWRLLASIQTQRNRYRMRVASTLEPKVFCIGLNKTGTTSWAQAMSELGFIVGSETRATMFFDDWIVGAFGRIVEYCRSEGQAFQDIPFSLPDTYKVIDAAFPGSKFVLTVRDSAEQWYNSLVIFHGKYFSKRGVVPPTHEDLSHSVYWRQGFLLDFARYVYKTPINDPYRRSQLLDFYQKYNSEVINYFVHRPNDFLVINVASEESYGEMCQFLGRPKSAKRFPWKNKT